MVLVKILASPLYNKEIKPFNLIGNQPVTPADSAEASTEGLQMERMDASTAKVPPQKHWRPRKGNSESWRKGIAQGSTGATIYQVELERTEQAYVVESW